MLVFNTTTLMRLQLSVTLTLVVHKLTSDWILRGGASGLPPFLGLNSNETKMQNTFIIQSTHSSEEDPPPVYLKRYNWVASWCVKIQRIGWSIMSKSQDTFLQLNLTTYWEMMCIFHVIIWDVFTTLPHYLLVVNKCAHRLKFKLQLPCTV